MFMCLTYTFYSYLFIFIILPLSLWGLYKKLEKLFLLEVILLKLLCHNRNQLLVIFNFNNGYYNPKSRGNVSVF